MARDLPVQEVDFPRDGSMAEQCRFLLNYAVLAPSSHNTQPWRFEVTERAVRFHMDHDRWLRCADPEKRELHLSVGCAVQAFVRVLPHFGLLGAVTYFPDEGRGDCLAEVLVRHADGGPERPSVLQQFALRHTSHGDFEDRVPDAALLAELQAAATQHGVSLSLVSDPDQRRQAAHWLAVAEARQFADPQWRAELADWIQQGVFGTGWMLSRLAALAVRYLDASARLAGEDEAHVREAPVLAVITCIRDEPLSWLCAGQAYMDICLLLARESAAVQPMSALVEDREARARLALLCTPEGRHPVHPFRIGYEADDSGRESVRRPLQDVLMDA